MRSEELGLSYTEDGGGDQWGLKKKKDQETQGAV
jgi:hypothetical protein